jgi:aminopeptidase N
MEQASGVELAWFFRQWLNRAGYPLLEGSWRYIAATKSIAIDLAQVQPGDAYRLPLELGLSFDGSAAPRKVKIEMTTSKQNWEIPVEGEPSAVVLDPNNDVLMRSRFGKR